MCNLASNVRETFWQTFQQWNVSLMRVTTNASNSFLQAVNLNWRPMTILSGGKKEKKMFCFNNHDCFCRVIIKIACILHYFIL